MKLLALCGFLFVFLLCLSAFTAEGRNVKKGCCLKLAKINRRVHKGSRSKMTPMQIRKCKPCAASGPVFAPGPLPQLK
ncbi:protein GPR15L-like [Lagopus leucura]|uniref:protein GPR15L-like n=1 Tax=Lagopus leucura TaxID=30410 RepID=UPI001C686BD3|nr:protein GPR15L-like [Lagopus leucura]